MLRQTSSAATITSLTVKSGEPFYRNSIYENLRWSPMYNLVSTRCALEKLVYILSPALRPYLIASSSLSRFARIWTLSNPETIATKRKSARLQAGLAENLQRSRSNDTELTTSRSSSHTDRLFGVQASRDRQRIERALVSPPQLCVGLVRHHTNMRNPGCHYLPEPKRIQVRFQGTSLLCKPA